MKRALSLLLVVVMVIGLFTACGGNTRKKRGQKDADSRELTVGIPQSANISSLTDNAFTKYIEESLDIKIEFIYYSGNSDEYQQQFSLDCSAGKDVPDVVWGFQGMSVYAMGDLGEDGYILDLSDMLETNFPHFQEARKKLSPEMQDYIVEKGRDQTNGAFYGMPLVALTHIDNLRSMPFINTAWLEKLGLEMPTNLDELYTVLKAFKEQDPNGNGKQDEVPFLGGGTGNGSVFAWIMNAFQYTNMDNPYIVEDGKVSHALTTEEFRDAVKYIRKLYQEGLISELCFSVGGATELIAMYTPADNVAKVGVWFGHPSIYTDANSTILDQYSVLTSLADATGKGGWTVIDPDAVKWCSFITADCPNPEVAAEFLDFMYVDETMTRMRWGEKGVYWDYGEEGENVKGEKTTIHVKDSSGFFTGSSTWGFNGNCIMNDANYTEVVESTGKTPRDKEVSRMMAELWDLMQNGKMPEEYVVQLVYSADDYDRKQELNNSMWNIYSESLTLFVVGEKDINDDAEWNAYLDAMKEAGEDEICQIIQRAYDEKNK